MKNSNIRQIGLTALVGILSGLLGMALWSLAAHTKADHDNLHALVNMVVMQQQEAVKGKAPPAAMSKAENKTPAKEVKK